MSYRTDQSLADAVIRLRKLDLDQDLRATVEEASGLLGEGRRLEAEALVENVDARVRQARSPDASSASSVPSTR